MNTDEVVKITDSIKKDGKTNKSQIQTWTMVLSTILLFVIALQLNGIAKNGGIAPTQAAALPQPTQAAPRAPTPSAPTVDMAKLVDDDPFKGDANAPVTMVEFSDFECPFCGRFYKQTLSQIESEYIDTGKVKFVYRDFPLSFHPQAQKSAEAAECAEDQDKFWEMHDMLFEKGVQGGPTSFKQFAADLGMNTAQFNDCLDSGKHQAEVQKDLADGSAAGVRGTPGFLINGKLVSGAQPFSAFQQIIEAELSQ